MAGVRDPLLREGWRTIIYEAAISDGDIVALDQGVPWGEFTDIEFMAILGNNGKASIFLNGINFLDGTLQDVIGASVGSNVGVV